jgi:hypothetical protein
LEQLMQRTFEELKANKAHCEQVEARLAEEDARAREADGRAVFGAGASARRSAETHAAKSYDGNWVTTAV